MKQLNINKSNNFVINRETKGHFVLIFNKVDRNLRHNSATVGRPGATLSGITIRRPEVIFGPKSILKLKLLFINN